MLCGKRMFLWIFYIEIARVSASPFIISNEPLSSFVLISAEIERMLTRVPLFRLMLRLLFTILSYEFLDFFHMSTLLHKTRVCYSVTLKSSHTITSPDETKDRLYLGAFNLMRI